MADFVFPAGELLSDFKRGVFYVCTTANLPESPALATLAYVTDATTGEEFQQYNGTAWVVVGSASGGGDLVDDLTPQLGGDLDVNDKKIKSTSNGDIEFNLVGTGAIKITRTS